MLSERQWAHSEEMEVKHLSNLTGRMPTKGREYSEHDEDEGRKRVATYADGDSVSYEDSEFDSGDSPVVCDVHNDLGGRNAHRGYVQNDGPGRMLVSISADGSTYGGIHTLREGESLVLDDLDVNRIRLTWVDNSAYRILAA